MTSSIFPACCIWILFLHRKFHAFDLIGLKGNFYPYLNKEYVITGIDVHRYRVSSALQCTHQCLIQHKTCNGTNFFEKADSDGLHECEVVFVNITSKDAFPLSNAVNWIYFSSVNLKTVEVKSLVNVISDWLGFVSQSLKTSNLQLSSLSAHTVET